MSVTFDTPLAQLYQELVEKGVLIREPDTQPFRYPSTKRYVPSITTYRKHTQ